MDQRDEGLAPKILLNTRVIEQISKRKCHPRILASPRVEVSLLLEYVGGARWVHS